MSTHNITVRGTEYEILTSLEETHIRYQEEGAEITLVLDLIHIGVPRHRRDSNGNVTTSIGGGLLTVSFFEEARFGKRYTTETKNDIVSKLDSYTKFYHIQPDELTGSTVHKAGLNAIGENEVGNKDGEVLFFNPLKDFTPFQPVIYDLIITDTSLEIDVVDSPSEGVLMYSLDGFATAIPLPPEPITLDAGDYTIGVLNSNDGMPFFKTFTIEEVNIEE